MRSSKLVVIVLHQMVIKLRKDGRVACIGYLKIYVKYWFGRPKGTNQLDNPTCRQEDNIKLDFKEIPHDVLVYILLAQDIIPR